MKTKTIIALNAGWAAAAVGAFLLGKSSTGPGAAEGAGASGNPSSAGGGVSAISKLGGDGLAASGASQNGDGTAAGGVTTEENAERKMASALSDRDPIRRKARISELLLNLKPEQVPGMLAAFENGERNDESNGMFRDFLYAWGRVGGADAIAYMMDPESKRRDHYGGTSAIAGWAASDLLAAKDYVGTTENAHAKEWLHYGVFREQLRSDLDGALAYSEENFKSRARGRQMDMLSGEIFRQQGMDGLVNWVAGIDHSTEDNDLLSYKQYASSLVLDRMAGEDPDAAAAWIADNGSEPYVSASALERAARRAGGEINEELEWLAALPAEVTGQRHAIGERFEDFIREDFAQAGNWLAAQPLGPAYDEAIQDYARSAARDDRAAALAWAERISDPEMRAETVRRVGGNPPQQG